MLDKGAQPHPEKRSAALIVAAGTGQRAGGGVPKQYALFRGKPMLRHSVERFAAWQGVDRIVVAIGPGQEQLARDALADIDGVAFVEGGADRRQSVANGLEWLAGQGGVETVYIHDAARPDLPEPVLDALAAALTQHSGAVPALPCVDSMARGDSDDTGAVTLGDSVDRIGLWRVQTPQAFHFDAILAAHRQWPVDSEATDDARSARAAGLNVAIVQGDERLNKITFESDLTRDERATGTFGNPQGPGAMPIVRTGMGYDVHRLVRGEELWLCGIEIPFAFGLSGHSDADVALHAITDAVLGAMALGDIGEHFPPSDPRWKGARSAQFLAHAAALVAERGGRIGNVDVTIICEAPKIGPHKAAMQARVAEILGLAPDQVAVKATTTEGLGFTGRREGIAAQAIVTIWVPLPAIGALP